MVTDKQMHTFFTSLRFYFISTAVNNDVYRLGPARRSRGQYSRHQRLAGMTYGDRMELRRLNNYVQPLSALFFTSLNRIYEWFVLMDDDSDGDDNDGDESDSDDYLLLTHH